LRGRRGLAIGGRPRRLFSVPRLGRVAPGRPQRQRHAAVHPFGRQRWQRSRARPDRAILRQGRVGPERRAVPCPSQPPPTPVVCCIAHSAAGAFVDDDPEVECEDDVSSAECAAQGGMVVHATSCDPTGGCARDRAGASPRRRSD